MKFPMLVYKSPGPHKAPGGTFQWLQVKNVPELEAAIADGCFPSPDLAVSQPEGWTWEKYAEEQGWIEPETETGEDGGEGGQDDDAPPTRAELEERAEQLGIKVHKNWKDETLAEHIAAKEAELAPGAAD